MTAIEMNRVLRGTDEEKRNLFDDLMGKAMSGEPLEDYEVVILETLKKMLFKAG